MNLQQAADAVRELATSIPSLFNGVDFGLRLGFGATPRGVGDWSDPDNPSVLITGDGIGCKSGVYFLCAEDGVIAYIGKAGNNNLHHRIWSHLATPQEAGPGRRLFPNHGFRAECYCSRLSAQIADGRIFLGIITISDRTLVSLVEVYLQTLHVKLDKDLPLLNRRIG